jgi:endonuclease/exonuclease/phosphatase family metal-dependent hydrolase
MIRSLFFLTLLHIAFSQSIRVATYNIYFLDAGITSERKARIDSVISELNADIIAFEEINNEAALKNILTDEYAIAMIDDPAEVQEVALAVRKPYQIISTKFLFSEKKYDSAFPRSRDCLEVGVRIGEKTIYFLVQHYKSRRGGRIQTDIQRSEASSLIVTYIKKKRANDHVIVLGDFNDNPDDRALNILEYGDEKAVGGIDSLPDTFLHNTSEALLERDMVSHGLGYTYAKSKSTTYSTVVAGSRNENNRFRGKEYDYYKDVKIKDTLLDQILISQNLKPFVLNAGIFINSAAVSGKMSKIKFTKQGLVYTFRGDFASDHVPVYLDLKFD